MESVENKDQSSDFLSEEVINIRENVKEAVTQHAFTLKSASDGELGNDREFFWMQLEKWSSHNVCF